MPFGKNNTVPEKCLVMDNDRILNGTMFDQHIMAALDDLKNGFGLTMVYYDQPDHFGHTKGPDSKQV